MPDSTHRSPGSLDRFLRQYWEDHDRGHVRPLAEYLVMCPGDTEAVAREFLALKDHEKDGKGLPPRGVSGQIAHYRILRELGGGGQGVVYLARDLRLDRDVAIKKLRGTYSIGSLERFRREARIASRLDHPGICPIYEIGDQDGDPYFVMRFVDGTTLSAKIGALRSSTQTSFTFVDLAEEERKEREATRREKPDRPIDATKGALAHTPSKEELNAVLRLIEQSARALHEAHEAGVIHRDIKPANIIVAKDGQPVLLDFGLATMTHLEVISVTETGQTPGTPAYMSPEQMTGGKIALDRRTDVYSLGVTLYECLTLTRPFDPSSQVARQILFKEAPDPRQFNAAISKDLKTVLETVLEKDRDRRYPTASEFADDLRRVREHEPIKARPVGPVMRLARWTQRNPAIAWSVLAIFVILAIALIVSLKALADTRTAEEAEAAKSKRLDFELSLSEPYSDLQQLNDLGPWSDRLWPAVPANAGGPEGMEAWIAQATALHAKKPRHDAALAEFSMPKDGVDEVERMKRVRVLETLTSELSGLDKRISEMSARRDAARSLPKRTIEDHRTAWEAIAAELAKDPAFASISPFKPQLGLIPVGTNRAGLFEFVVAESGTVPERDPTSGDLKIDEKSGVILVLLPGGQLRFHPSSNDTARLNDPEDPVVEVKLPPYLIGKHEVTQAQWVRRTGSNVAAMRPPPNVVTSVARKLITPMHPLENMTFAQATDFCGRLGLRLPVQDEWEFAARARAGLNWGDCADIACLEGKENLGDLEFGGRHPENRALLRWNDGFASHSPIGTFAPNSFGLHDMLGNVAEVCADVYMSARPTSGEASRKERAGELWDYRLRVVRGSTFQRGAMEASCAWFRGMEPNGIQPAIGFRVARTVDR